MKRIATVCLLAVLAAFGFSACSSDADVASKNLSKAADNFEVQRRIVFVNGITDKHLLEIEGACSLGNNDDKYTTVTCKLPDGTFVKHFLLRSDNVTVVVEQLIGVEASTSHYRMIWKPSEAIPDVDVR